MHSKLLEPHPESTGIKIFDKAEEIIRPGTQTADNWRPRPFRTEQLPPPSSAIPAFLNDLLRKNSHEKPEQSSKEIPFYLEIGAGNAKHAVDFALKNRTAHLVAIERTSGKARKAKNRIHRISDTTKKSSSIVDAIPPANQPKLSNLTFVQDDAINWVAHHLKMAQPCLSGVYLLYPNPYPKKSQRNKRFHYMPFMTFLSELMLPCARFVLATNDPSYFRDACFILPEHFSLQLVTSRILDPRKEPRTNFEKVFFERGILCYEAVFEKQ